MLGLQQKSKSCTESKLGLFLISLNSNRYRSTSDYNFICALLLHCIFKFHLPLQVCAGHNAGEEAAIHAMSQVFVEEGTDGILLIDASNAFNQMNRSAALHNIQIMCKEMALYVINTYRSPSRLFICGGGEILSREGTTQGDPLAMPWYALNTSIMIQNLRDHCPLVKQVWLADDSAGGGSIVHLYNWYRQLSKEGQKFGYLVNGTKS